MIWVRVGGKCANETDLSNSSVKKRVSSVLRLKTGKIEKDMPEESHKIKKKGGGIKGQRERAYLTQTPEFGHMEVWVFPS